MLTKQLIKDFVESKTRLNDISKRTKEEIYADARAMYYALCFKYKDAIINEKTSLAAIGKVVLRNHATVLHGLKIFHNNFGTERFSYGALLYKDICDEINKVISNQDYSSIKDSKDVNLIKQYYRIKHILTVEKQHKIINRYRAAFSVLETSDVLKRVAKLSPEDFKAFERQFDVFVKVRQKLSVNKHKV